MDNYFQKNSIINEKWHKSYKRLQYYMDKLCIYVNLILVFPKSQIVPVCQTAVYGEMG